MTNANQNEIYLSSSPHFTKGLSTQKIMALVLIALLPESIFGIVLFGLRALMTILVSVISCVAFEALFQVIVKQKVQVSNLSAAVTGLMLALVLPPTTPLWMTVLGAFIAVVVAKGLFGGLGANVFNPALTGRAFLFISFGAALGASWLNIDSAVNLWSLSDPASSAVDAISSATVMSLVKGGTLPVTMDLVKDCFFGTVSGCIGETSALLILISFVFLLVTKVIDPRASISMVLTVALSSFIYSLCADKNLPYAAVYTLYQIVSGGLLFGAVFMITDYTTAPVTSWGRIIFGVGAGIITFLIRTFGGYPEGVMFSILIMNTLASFLNNITTRKYGYGKKAEKKSVPKFLEQTFDVSNAVERKEESK